MTPDDPLKLLEKYPDVTAAIQAVFNAFDLAGRILIVISDLRVQAIASIVTMLVVARARQSRQFPLTPDEWLYGALSVLGIGSALQILGAMVLTSPPAVSALSRSQLVQSGLAAVLMLTWKSVSTLRDLRKKSLR